MDTALADDAKGAEGLPAHRWLNLTPAGIQGQSKELQRMCTLLFALPALTQIIAPAQDGRGHQARLHRHTQGLGRGKGMGSAGQGGHHDGLRSERDGTFVLCFGSAHHAWELERLGGRIVYVLPVDTTSLYVLCFDYSINRVATHGVSAKDCPEVFIGTTEAGENWGVGTRYSISGSFVYKCDPMTGAKYTFADLFAALKQILDDNMVVVSCKDGDGDFADGEEVTI